MSNYLEAGLLQLYAKSKEDIVLTIQPEITFFKYAYKNNGLYYKDDIILKDITLKWNDNYYYKLQKDIEYMGPMWLKVSIPYSQLVSKQETIVSSIMNTSNINEMIYNNINTYLIIINENTPKYYLVPLIFFTLPYIKGLQYFNINDITNIIQFSDINSYFNNILSQNVMGDTMINFYTFQPDKYNHDIIPLLYDQTTPYNKLMLDHILSNNDDICNIYCKNLLNQNSFDYYITNLINNILINNFQEIYKFDKLVYYYIMSNEIKYYYNYYINSVPSIPSNLINCDLDRALAYFNTVSTTLSVDILLKQTINMNALLLQYILLTLNPSIHNIYTFYKKFSIIMYPTTYNVILTSANIVDVNDLKVPNLISAYYPNYTINISSLNLPFTLTNAMLFTTLDGKTATYADTNNISTLNITDTVGNTITLTELPIIIDNYNNTENIVTTDIIYNDTNSNTEWTTNMLNGMGSLDYNQNIEMYLFTNINKNYYLIENNINNIFNGFIDTPSNLTNLWIELKTIVDRFIKPNTELGFNKDDTFITNKNITISIYKDILNIENYPQDMTNTYAVCINYFITNIMNKYFHDETFLNLFYNKINSYIYQRYIRISKFNNTNIINFNGILFYYNIDLKEYITKAQIKKYLIELFNMNTIICYIDMNLNGLTLKSDPIVSYQSSQYNNVDNTSYFYELKIKNEYNVTDYTINMNKLTTSNIFQYNINNLVHYSININSTYYNVISTNLDSMNNIIFTTDNNYMITNTDNITIYETIIQSIPCINLDSLHMGKKINTNIVTIYDRNLQINLFEKYNMININIANNSILIFSYQKDNINDIVVASYNVDTNTIISPNLKILYNTYDKIIITIISMPCTYLTITDTDCMQDISTTYPYIYLLKSSSVYTSNFNKINTIKTIDNINIRIVDDNSNSIKMYCYDTNRIFNNSSLDIVIMDNKYLPNLYEYTSLNPSISSMMDYMIQKPFIIKLYDTSTIPMYCIANININSSSKMYLNNTIINMIYNLNSDQLIRDNSRLYGTYYYDGLLLENVNSITILDNILNEYEVSYDGIYNNVISTIEYGQTHYAESFNEILSDINSTTKYGTTINKLENSVISMNEMKYISNISTYVMKLNSYNAVDYDAYTLLAVSLYNLTNINGQIIVYDEKIIVSLANKYNHTNKNLINSPWLSYNSNFKLSNTVNNFLTNYSNYSLIQTDKIDNNKTILVATNNMTFPQAFTQEYEMRDKYIKLFYNIDKVNIKLLYDNPWIDINTSDINIVWMKDNNILTLNTDGTFTCTNTNIPKYKDNMIYDEQIQKKNSIKMIGPVMIQNNKISLQTVLPNNIKYIVADDNSVIDCSDNNSNNNNNNNNNNNINYNSSSIQLNTMEFFSFTKLPVSYYYYQIKQSNMIQYFNTIDSYYMNIDNTIFGYAKFNGSYLILLLNQAYPITMNTVMFYTIMNETVIINNIINNITTGIIFPYMFTFIDMKITSTSKYNYYNMINWTYNEFVIFQNNNIVPQYYNDYIVILGMVMINFYNTYNSTITLEIYNSSTTLLPPIYINNNKITIFNPLEDFNWTDDKNAWLYIDNISFQVKDIDNIVDIMDGNYLMYYSSIKLNPLKYPDIFTDTYYYDGTIYNVNYDPYNNSIILIGDIVLAEPYNNYIANNSLIEKITNTSDTTTINMYPMNENIVSTIILKSNNIHYNRPFLYTNIMPTSIYYIYDTNNNMIDSFFTIDIELVSSSDIFVGFINFTSNANLITNSNMIKLIQLSPMNYMIFVTNSRDITINTYHMITLYNGEDMIIFWLYVGDYPTVNMYNDDMIIYEPRYIDYYNSITLTLDNNDVTFDSVDSRYFNFININTITTITNNVIDMLVIKNNKFLNMNEVENDASNLSNNMVQIFSASFQESKNVISSYNSWIYVTSVNILNNTINNSVLSQYNNYIFINNNKIEYNENKMSVNNIINLLYPTDLSNNIDVFIYPFDPIFIKANISYIVDGTTIYLYTDVSKLQRNEIIKINNMMICVLRWSKYNASYIGNILNNMNQVANINSGYYSYGKLSNLYDMNNLLNNSSINNLLYGTTNKNINRGDYYITNNTMYIYDDNMEIGDYIFKYNAGTTIKLYYINNNWYFDDISITIIPNMILIYIFDDIMYKMIVEKIDGNIIKFNHMNVINETIITIYIPNQPFISSNIVVYDNMMTNYDNFNGWIEQYVDNNVILTSVRNSIISGEIPDGTISVRLIDMNSMDIKHDFNNYMNHNNTSQIVSNKRLPLSIDCNINRDDTYIYFTNNIMYDFTNLNYIYYQSILVSSVWFHVIDITPSRIYIELLSNMNSFDMTKSSYKVIFSSGDINNINIVSNNYILNNSYKLNYPTIDNNNNENMITLLSSNMNTFTNTSDDIVINNNNIISKKFNEILNTYEYINMNMNNYYENYIPLKIDATSYNNDGYSFIPLILSFINNGFVMLQEITNDNMKYQHYIEIEIVNNFFKIKSNNNFHNINTSTFYLYNIIPVLISINNYIIVLDSTQYKVTRPINVLVRNTMTATIYIMTNVIGKPIKVNNTWKYMINFTQAKYNIILNNMNTLYYDNSNICTITTDGTYYYIITNNIISVLTNIYFTETHYIDTVDIISKTVYPEYTDIQGDIFNLISQETNNAIKLVNRVNINNINYNAGYYYNISIIDNNNNMVTFGNMIGNNYMGDYNNITNVNIDNNMYNIMTTYPLDDISNSNNKYNLSREYNYNSTFIINKPEVSPSLPSLAAYLNDMKINFAYIVNQTKPWREWTLISTRYNMDLIVYLNANSIIYNGTLYSTIEIEDYTSYFTSNETSYIKDVMKILYNDYISLNILRELYKVESYLANLLVKYITQNYFWENINIIIKELVENYVGTFNWTFNNNIIMIVENNILETTLYPNNFKQSNNKMVRCNYLSVEFDIVYNISELIVSRNPSYIDTELNNIVNYNDTTYSLTGVMMDNVITILNNMMIEKQSIITNKPLSFLYMNSKKYFIAKLYDDLINTNNTKLNILSDFQIKIENFSQLYSGKYFNNTFDEVNFGLNSTTHYKMVDNIQPNDTTYIIPYKTGLLNKVIIDTDTINILQTNSLFSYNILLNDMMLQTKELISSNNTYNIMILDDFQHNDSITVVNDNINTNSILFYSDKMISPVDIVVGVNHKFNIVNKINYGNIYNITIDGTINKNDTIYYNNIIVLFLKQINEYEYNIATINIDNTTNIFRIESLVAIIKYNIVNNKVYLILSNNMNYIVNTTFYIEINNNIYYLYYDGSSYYIEDDNFNQTIDTNILYKVYRFVSIINFTENNNMVADIFLDNSLNETTFQTDTTLKPSFMLDGMVEYNVLTQKSLRVTHNNVLGSVLTYNYDLRQSIPYKINSIINQYRYSYQLPSINMIRINDMIKLVDSMNTEYDGMVYNVDNNMISFFLSSYILINDVKIMNLTIIKKYILNVISTDNNIIVALIPSDLYDYNYIYAYYATIDDIIYSVTVTFENNLIITFPTNISINITSFEFEQHLITVGNNITMQEYNTLYQVKTINNSIVTNISNFYQPIIQTLDTNMNKFTMKYYYNFTTIIDSNIISTYKIIYIVSNNNYILCNVIMIQENNIIVGTDTMIDSMNNTLYTPDFIYMDTVTLYINSYMYSKGQILEQIDNMTYNILFPYNTLYEYNNDNNITTNMVTIFFRYSDITTINQSYPNLGYNKIPDTIITTTTSNTNIYEIKWIDNLPSRIFNSIQLSIDDNIIEKLDYDIYTIYINYMIDIWGREKFNKMTSIKYNNDKSIYFNLPIIFMFTRNIDSYLPLKKLNRSIVKIKFNTSQLSDMIVNYSSGKMSKNIYPIIDINYSYVITNIENKINYMLLDCMYSYTSNILNNIMESNHLNLYNRTIDLFLITSSNNVKTTTTYDMWYSEYIANNIIDFRIFDLIDDEIKIKSRRYNVLSSNSIIINPRFAMYLDEKYLQYIDENLNDVNLKYSQKITILILYFTKIYTNMNIIKNVDMIDSINIQINGHDLLPNLPSSYLNNVIPYLKGFILPDGHYMYSFAYNSLDKQPCGMLNLKNIKDLLINSQQNVTNQNINMKVCAHEYRILKIDNNMGKLIN